MRSKLALTAAVTMALAVGMARGGEKRADPAKTEEHSKRTGNHYLAFWKQYLQGEWDTTVVAGDPTGTMTAGATGTWTCRLAPSKACMIFSATNRGRPLHTTIAGYDPKSKSWKEVSFMADGSHLIQHYQARPADLAGDPIGKVIKGKAEYITPDGKVERCAIQVAAFARDKWEYSCTNRHIGKRKLPDLRMIFERKK